MTAPICFLDTETTGLEHDSDIWEIAAIRREPDGTEHKLHMFVSHAFEKCTKLPEPFLTDHRKRYDSEKAVARHLAAAKVHAFTSGAYIVGAVPNFDTERLAPMFRELGSRPPWHYHLIDVENLVVGYLRGLLQGDRPLGLAAVEAIHAIEATEPPWDSEELSRLVGVDPDKFERHTAMGDVRWAMAMYDAVMGR